MPVLAVATAFFATTFLQAQRVPIPTMPTEVPGPLPGNIMSKEYVQMVGRMAYVWGYPLVNAHNRRAAFSEAPAAGLLGGVVPIAPVGYSSMLTNYISPEERSIVCPNQDVVYGAGFTDLDKVRCWPCWKLTPLVILSKGWIGDDACHLLDSLVVTALQHACREPRRHDPRRR